MVLAPAAGDYVFSMQVDDQATIAIGDRTILFLDGAHWFENVTSDTVRFESSGSYPLRAYYADCQPCCRGFRLGGMGPDGSDGAAHSAGIVSYPWSPEASRADQATSSVLFYRVRTGDGSAAAGIIVTVR